MLGLTPGQQRRSSVLTRPHPWPASSTSRRTLYPSRKRSGSVASSQKATAQKQVASSERESIQKSELFRRSLCFLAILWYYSTLKHTQSCDTSILQEIPAPLTNASAGCSTSGSKSHVFSCIDTCWLGMPGSLHSNLTLLQ